MSKIENLVLERPEDVLAAAALCLKHGAGVGDLDALRTRIRALDRTLVELIAARIDVCLAVGEQKRQQGMVVRNREVETRVIASAQRQGQEQQLCPDLVERVMRNIIEYSVARQDLAGGATKRSAD